MTLHYAGNGNLNEVFDLSNSKTQPLDIKAGDGNDVIRGGTFDYLNDPFKGFSNFLAGGWGSDMIFAGNVPNTILGDDSPDPFDIAGSADLIIGGVNRDFIYAGGGNDFVNAGSGKDYIEGGMGDDIIWGGYSKDVIHGGGGSDDIYANSAKSAPANLLSVTTDWNGVTNTYAGGLTTLQGTAGEISNAGDFAGDELFGEGGKDHLHGDYGLDTMTGGGGKDHFVFETVALGSAYDIITDFSHADDTIDLDNGVLAGLGANGWLVAAKFYKGGAAHDTSDRIIYNPNNGVVWFDQDGKGGNHVAFKLCVLDQGLNVTAADFLVI